MRHCQSSICPRPGGVRLSLLETRVPMPSSSMSQQQLVSQLFLKHSPRIRGFILSMQPDMLAG